MTAAAIATIVGSVVALVSATGTILANRYAHRNAEQVAHDTAQSQAQELAISGLRGLVTDLQVQIDRCGKQERDLMDRAAAAERRAEAAEIMARMANRRIAELEDELAELQTAIGRGTS